MIDPNGSRTNIRLAAIPQALADGFSFQMVHHASAKMVAATKNAVARAG